MKMKKVMGRRLRLSALTVTVGAMFLSACASGPGGEEQTEAAAGGTTVQSGHGDDSGSPGTEGEWPRTFTNAAGSATEIPAQPEHIVSTTVSTTGTLLAFDAPVIASATAGNGEFFAQWDDVAHERGVENLWAAGEVDLEAVYSFDPDLIVVSISGADSLADNVDELGEIAPTIVVDYGGQTWQELALELASALGLEEQAQEAVADFDSYVADAAATIEVPDGEVNVVSFNGPGESNPIARAGSAQAELLESLGFTIEDPPVEWHSQGSERADFVWANYENLTELTGETTFILSQENEGAQAFAEDPVLANVASVVNEQVYGLGVNSFRIDKYSATEIVDGAVANFGG